MGKPPHCSFCWVCFSGDFLSLGPYCLVAFGEYFLFFLEFLSKSKSFLKAKPRVHWGYGVLTHCHLAVGERRKRPERGPQVAVGSMDFFLPIGCI